MSNLIDKILKFIYSKKKQILFALFAFICLIIDSKNTGNLIKAAAPAVVAAAAKGGAAIAKGTSAVAKGASVAAKGADAGAKASSAVANAKNAVDASKSLSASNNVMNQANNSKFTNTALKNNTGLPSNLGVNSTKNSPIIPSSKGLETENSDSDENTENKRKSNNYVIKPFVPSKPVEDDESEGTIMDDVSSKVIKRLPMIMTGCFLGGMLLFVCLVPMLLLGVVNATSSTVSQIDCTKQQSDNCEADDSSDSFFHKLKNLFTRGTYGSNSEVVLKKIEDAYDSIKEEYDFQISLSLLTSSLFSDEKYIETNLKDGNFVITDEMMERIEYVYPISLMQLIPEYNVFTCEARLVDGTRNMYEYVPIYEYTKVPTYDEGDTTEEEMELIITGECDASTAGGQYKKITYFFDDELYFKRLMISEELDLVYYDSNNDDELLVSQIGNQYYTYKNIYNVDVELEYSNIPIQLYDDINVNIQTPLKGRYSITSPFGMRTGEYAGMHNGIDLVSSDKNIYAAGSGIVTRSNVETEGGNVIEITHTDSSGRKYVTQYAHLSERHVNVGDVINSGDVIGIMGDTGTMASGVHLHFSMWDKETREYYNPRKLFSEASNY